MNTIRFNEGIHLEFPQNGIPNEFRSGNFSEQNCPILLEFMKGNSFRIPKGIFWISENEYI